MIPFYIFYSMFGFQRTGDEFWAFGDARGRGFLLGATAGRTTLNGEGLQHEDGHSLLNASVYPSARVYDPAFAYETAIVIREGLDRMLRQGKDDLYYLTLYNENHVMPPVPEGADVAAGVLRGLYPFRKAPEVKGVDRRGPLRATLLGSGSIMQQVLKAQAILAERFGVAADVWSAPSYQLLRNDALEVEHWNRHHPTEQPRVPFVTEALAEAAGVGPIVAATDFVKAVPDQVSRWIPGGSWRSLGTDGFGRSDTREALRRFFEVDADHIAFAVLTELGRCGQLEAAAVAQAMEHLGIDADAPFSLLS
jgi:pyruvate dehydrogenase E1 component